MEPQGAAGLLWNGAASDEAKGIGSVKDMSNALQEMMLERRGNQEERGNSFVGSPTAVIAPQPMQQERQHDVKAKGTHQDKAGPRDMRSTMMYSQIDSNEDFDVLNIYPVIDTRVMCNMRDGKILVGTFRSVDHFANIVLTHTIERVFVGNKYGEIRRGLVLIRGDNLVMIGEVNEATDGHFPGMTKVSFQTIMSAQKEQMEAVKKREAQRLESFKARGLNYAAVHHQDHKTFAEQFQVPDDQFN